MLRTMLLALAAALAACATPAADEPDGEALYLERFRDITTNGRGELSRYDPMETVPGASDHQPLPTAAPPARTIAEPALAAARDYAAANNSSAFLVWHKGKLQHASYFGETTPATPIVSKSLAKPLTAIAVGRAIALGHIRSLDQPAADFITEWRGTPKEKILVRHLLDMRSGLLAQGFSTDPQNNPWARAYLHPYHERYIVADYPLTDPPGSVYEYSNATSDLVAVLLERATGERYPRFIGEQVLQPIGAMGGEVWVNRPGGTAHAGCCMLLPAESWLRLGVLLEQDGVWGDRRLLPPGYVAQMRRGTPQNPNYGLGLWLGEPYAERRGFANPSRPGPKVLHSEPYAARDTFLFDGNSNQVVYVVPSEDLVVLRVGGSPPKTPEWDNSRLANLILRGIERAPARAAGR